MTDTEEWCIKQEYVGINDFVERYIKIFYDYRKTHSREEYEKLVRDKHTGTRDDKLLEFINDGDTTKVLYRNDTVGRIVCYDNEVELVSYSGIGDGKYPVVDRIPVGKSFDELTEYYGLFDKYVLKGDYLLDTTKDNTINHLYLRFIRNNYDTQQ